MTEQELRDQLSKAPNSSFGSAVLMYACPDPQKTWEPLNPAPYIPSPASFIPSPFQYRPATTTTTGLLTGASPADRDAILHAFKLLAPTDWADRARDGSTDVIDTLVRLVEYLLEAPK